MAIPESQLDVWAKQGSITQSQTTYATVRTCLLAPDTPYAARSKSVFLQGSYGNDTNIYADSDVDVVIVTDSIYYYGTEDLKPDELAVFTTSHSVGASYSYNQFKAEVSSHLTTRYRSAVKPGRKAILIEGDGNRRDTDVLPAVEYRRYTRFRTDADSDYDSGITFWTRDGVQIINYPKQHSTNATAKHQRTGSWFKPTVRILKNMRNAMIAKGYLAEGIAPSYFLEGALYNVPNDRFGVSYADTFVNVVNWISQCDRTELLCTNEQYLLLHPSSPVTWRAEHLQSFLNASIKFWNEW